VQTCSAVHGRGCAALAASIGAEGCASARQVSFVVCRLPRGTLCAVRAVQPPEDEALRALAAAHGECDWHVVARELGTGRSPFACFARFQRRLNGCVRRRPAPLPCRLLNTAAGIAARLSAAWPQLLGG
jgi:hypothetical protein